MWKVCKPELPPDPRQKMWTREPVGPEYYQEPQERMIADMHKTILELRQEVHELRLAVVEQNRRQRMMEADGK